MRLQSCRSLLGALLLSLVACNRQSPSAPQSLQPSAQPDNSLSAASPSSDPTDKGSISYAKDPERFAHMPVVQPQFNLKNPQTATDYFDVGVHEDNVHHYDAAIAAYKQALRLKPDWALLVLREAKDYRRMGRTQDAIQQFRRATKMDPQYWDAYSELSLTYKDSGDTRNAIKAATKLLDFPPLQIPAYNQLGYWYEELGDRPTAKREFELYRDLSQKTKMEPQTDRYKAAMLELQKLSQ